MYENVLYVYVCMLGWPDPVISVLSCCLDFFVLALLYSPVLVFHGFSYPSGIVVGCYDNANPDDYNDGGGNDANDGDASFFFSMIFAEHLLLTS